MRGILNSDETIQDIDVGRQLEQAGGVSDGWNIWHLRRAMLALLYRLEAVAKGPLVQLGADGKVTVLDCNRCQELTATVEELQKSHDETLRRMEQLNGMMTILCEQEAKIRRGWVDEEMAREALQKRVVSLEEDAEAHLKLTRDISKRVSR